MEATPGDSQFLEIRILGPVAAIGRTGPIALGGPKDRALLAQLAMAAPRTVAEAVLIDGIYGDNGPARVTKVIQNMVFRLRRALRAAAETADVIVTEPGGYRLAGSAIVVDVHAVDALSARARQAMDTGAFAEASGVLGDALDMWRGDALGDVADMPFAAPATVRLHEVRLALIEERFEAELACGHHHRLVGMLMQAVKETPLRERLWGQLMVALYRSGRQAEALRTFQELRLHLDNELGLAPGDELAAIERDIAAGLMAPSSRPGGLVEQHRQLPAEGHQLLAGVDRFHGLSRGQLFVSTAWSTTSTSTPGKCSSARASEAARPLSLCRARRR